jgi:glutamate synthase domain-containing protein 3
VQIGLICSEKQAIDATLRSLAREDPRFCPVADRYWNARGGSHTDGGAFIFTVGEDAAGRKTLACTDKFGRPVEVEAGSVRCDLAKVGDEMGGEMPPLQSASAQDLYEHAMKLPNWSPGALKAFCDAIVAKADSAKTRATAIEALTMLHDRRFDTGDKRRSSVLHVLEDALDRLFDSAPLFGEPATQDCRRIDWDTRDWLAGPSNAKELLCIDAEKFPPEGDDCDATLLCNAFKMGWRRFVVYRLRGQRFTGAGLGLETSDVRIDVYGSSGDYLASGIDGMEIHIHGNAQDQVAQVMKRGKLVIHGDVGQTFMYGAKGGDVYVLGNAAGRPLINAVGRPRVVINGTCLDFLAESFMAGDPLNGGGFVILNGIAFDPHGRIIEQPVPYPGSNLFSLASGGAIYIRDPHRMMVEGQLNGGVFLPLSEKDWRLIRTYLQENERLFGIPVERLLTVDGQVRDPAEVYRKVDAVKLQVLAAATEKKR